ncbi:MAG: GerAB/ArcD/ProY family transporter [Oscillospiraceae bacterium]
MRNEKAAISRHQLFSLGFLGLLSPIIRLLPHQAVLLSGAGAWLSALLTAIPVGLVFLLSMRFFKFAMPNEGFAELFIRALGHLVGRGALLLFTLWLIFYTGFTLRSSADRYITTAYQNASPELFIIIMLALALIAALGTFPALARSAEVFFPLLLVVLVGIFAFSFQDVDFTYLPPVTTLGLPSVLLGILPVANVLSLSLNVGFLEGRVCEKKKRSRQVFLWLAAMTATVTVLCLVTVGIFGAELTGKLTYPFFVMIRNITVFNILERLEAVIMALWVITDFALVSTLLFICVNNLRVCFNYLPSTAEKSPLLKLKNGRFLIWICAGLSLLTALFIAPDSQTLSSLSRNIIPAINLAFNFALLPAIIAVGLIRKKV